MPPYVALLRGINVGGKNIIKMADLKACFEAQGLQSVSTYIQSGNVLFQSPDPAAKLVPRLEKALASTFKYNASLVLRSQAQLQSVLKKAPKGFGSQPEKYRYDVIFLKDLPPASQLLPEFPLKPGVDTAHAGPEVIYCTRLIAKATQSRISKITALAWYKQMTIRNWNTTLALAEGLAALK